MLILSNVKLFFLLLYFLHRFLTHLVSTGGPHEISRRAACGPRAAGWTALGYDMIPFRGIHPPWGNDAFPRFSDIAPHSRKCFKLRGKFPQFHLFLKNFPFSSAKISDDLCFSHSLKMVNFNFPYFRCFNTFPTYRKIIISPRLFQMFPFVTFTCFLNILSLCVFRFPLLLSGCT